MVFRPQSALHFLGRDAMASYRAAPPPPLVRGNSLSAPPSRPPLGRTEWYSVRNPLSTSWGGMPCPPTEPLPASQDGMPFRPTDGSSNLHPSFSPDGLIHRIHRSGGRPALAGLRPMY